MAGKIRTGGGDLAEVGDDGCEVGDALTGHDGRVVLGDPAAPQLAHDDLHGCDRAGGLRGLAPHEVVVVGCRRVRGWLAGGGAAGDREDEECDEDGSHGVSG